MITIKSFSFKKVLKSLKRFKKFHSVLESKFCTEQTSQNGQKKKFVIVRDNDVTNTFEYAEKDAHNSNFSTVTVIDLFNVLQVVMLVILHFHITLTVKLVKHQLCQLLPLPSYFRNVNFRQSSTLLENFHA